MKLIDECLRIAEHIAAWITGSATEADIQKLNEWKQESEKYDQLFNELVEQQSFAENQKLLERFPVDEGWNKVKRHLSVSLPKPKKLIQRISYAAIFLLCIGGGWMYLQNINRQEIVKTTTFSKSMPAGKQTARLTLGDGKIIDMLPEKTFTITESDGTLIQKGTAGIDYTLGTSTKDTLLYNQMETLTGMEYMLTLADGTRVYLNAESRIKYPVIFHGKERVVELQGEAYFKVAKDIQHPFIVKMKEVEVKVVGTSFNARKYDNESDIITTLVEGKVEINGQPIIPGEQAIFSYNTGELTVKKVDTDQYTAWQEGKFVFRNERLEDIMKTLARWYGIEYHFLDPKVKEIRIGASFGRYEDMNPILEMLKSTELVDILQTNQGVYLSIKK